MKIGPTRMEVSLENFRHNFRAIREKCGTARIIAVVKANAYGMGAVPVAWALEGCGADFFAVATPDEAVELREAGISAAILVMGASPPRAAETYVKLGISAAVSDLNFAAALSREATRQNRAARVHLKIDTGMGRIGFSPEEASRAAETIHSLPGLDFEGVFTHFAKADEEDLSHTEAQFAIFKASVERIRGAGIPVRIAHCCNSGAVLAGLSHMYMNAVRPGHILSGLIPSPECRDGVSVRPCFEVKTAISVIRELPEGTGVSYGHAYVTAAPERVAVLPIGYADGFGREMSGIAEVLIRGTRCPVRGRICMDQCVAGISHVKDAETGDEAVLIGRQGAEAITIEEFARKKSSITGTVPVSFTGRVQRIYV
ncbi:MAG: alanine racemase [Synergistaceae bacterium]|nr:alanine racemase [Synergistaceae bacterium]